MSSSAFYLKYRPQSLDDLIGQEIVKKTLLSSFTQNRLSHAYLFSGPRGTGKTSTARILAKMVNCESQGVKESEASKVPCNKCATCLSITDGSNLDLIEIDAASNRGIEDIRSLREKIKLAPTSSKKKVYIIDEVHMLTTEAFNALLKTLEEPPSHALFILATTDVQKLPQTILSRVQKLDFKLATNLELEQALQKIVDKEKIQIESEALKIVVKKAEGSFRDGVKFLDQVSSTGEKISVENLQISLNSSKIELILELLAYLIKKDTTQALALIVKQEELGLDCKELILSLMDTFRNLVFIKNELGPQLIKDNLEELTKLSEGFTNKDLVFNLEILQKALEKLKTSSIPSLPLELAIVEMCDEQVQVVKPQTIVKVVEQVAKVDIKEPIAVTENIVVEEIKVENLEVVSGPSDDMQKIKDKWQFVLETIRPFNFSLEALLRSTNVKECTEKRIVMEVPYSFHQRILEAPKNRDLLESVLSDVLGRQIQIATVLGVRTPRREDVANIELAQDDEIIRAAAEIFSTDTIN